jgi:hypothetical protein
MSIPPGLTHLVLDGLGRADQDAADDRRVHDQPTVVEEVVGAALDSDPQVAVVVGVGLGDEAVGQLVADQRLGQVDEVDDQDLGRGRPGRDRTVVVVDQLDDGQVAGQDDRRVVGALTPTTPSVAPNWSTTPPPSAGDCSLSRSPTVARSAAGRPPARRPATTGPTDSPAG